MGKSQRTKDILVGVVAGSVLGAITALLFAPKPGKELRADIKQQAQQVGEKTAQFAGAVAEKTQEVAGTVSTTTTEWVGKAKTAASEVIDNFRQKDKTAEPAQPTVGEETSAGNMQEEQQTAALSK
ncbi:YtxH domain-containing protein [Paenibacillus larvae]|uniref:YtxH domain-containing protein n=1 Tax=Paenibacillus larvae TaxID=1464 RepID=A0AAP5N3B6_9BACL|nr:YtxH domain-containing protein [Paenibacillus larvae]AQR78029.1 hypothetical protein BXP28_12565 [Paenibacillus larvae subsp. larvae]AVF20803.1 Gas vesicle protein [Paenibacillus larvae subsp. larvae]ETK28230.1 hypothetical protein ERIC1_1c16910 [Paenibacillus larvae subsp. larvae DSM 25719]MCY7475853.1 YtxH domain-containing protein [Paenibacillus larvae]MCY7491209.1 YtxH domain-containing protein [Paenibacillus larvae]